MGLSGSRIVNTNVIFRLLLICFAGIAVFAVLVSWKAQAVFTAEYVEFPKTHSQVRTMIKAETDMKIIKKDLSN